MLRRLLLISTVFLATGCASLRPAPIPDAPAASAVYDMPIERARILALTVMSNQFPGQRVAPLPAPEVGYSAEVPLLIGKWTANLRVTPVAVQALGQAVQAVRFETEQRGILRLASRGAAESLRVRLKEALEGSGAPRIAD